MIDKIITYQDISQGLIFDFIQAKYRENIGTSPPRLDKSLALPAKMPYISYGRWVVECDVCFCAVNLDMRFLYFLCYSEGCAENQTWYELKLPDEWEGIEDELMKRPNPNGNPLTAVNRHWMPHEYLNGSAVDYLAAENAIFASGLTFAERRQLLKRLAQSIRE